MRISRPFSPTDWEVWHTYSTYVDNPEIDLLQAAISLVRDEVAECIVSSTGEAFWLKDRSVVKALLSVEHDIDEGKVVFNCRSERGQSILPTGFALEALGQAVQFNLAEGRVLGGDLPLTEQFLRVFLGKIVVEAGEGAEAKLLNLYPTLLIHTSGVLILELRMIGLGAPLSLEDFIAQAVNLPRLAIRDTLVGPGLARIATEAYYRSAQVPFFSRFRYLSAQRLHNQVIEKLTIESQDCETIKFRLSPWSGESVSLREIATSIFHAAAYLTSKPRRGIAFLLLGAKSAPDLGAFWSGRPHIHLIRYQNQQMVATENDRVHRHAFSSILSRTPHLAGSLPPNMRLFKDYSAFITSSASLWAWSGSGYSQQKLRMDPNRANFIYERQVLMEVLEYGYMLHRGLYHQIETLRSTDQVMSVRRLILGLRLRMKETSHSGEIRKLFEEGWKALDLPALVRDIDAALIMREADMRSADVARATRVGWAIAIIFGLVAVPALADQIVTPAWHLLRLHTSPNADKMKLVTAGVATLAIITLLRGTLFILTKRDQKS